MPIRAIDIKVLTDLKGILRPSGISERPMECRRMLIAQISLILKLLLTFGEVPYLVEGVS